MKSTCLFVTLAATLAAAASPSPVPAETDVLVVGGTAKGVAAATAARKAGASVFLVTPYTYLGEDLAGTLELGVEPGARPTLPLVKKLWAGSSDLAVFDYTPDHRSQGLRWIYHNDPWERLSEPGRPPSPSDAVFYTDDVSYRCVLRAPAKISRIEVLVLESHARATEGGEAVDRIDRTVSRKKVAATDSVSCTVTAGPLKGKTLELKRRPDTFAVKGDYYRGNAQAVSFVAEADAELSACDIVVRKAASVKHQLVSRIWFHLSDAASFSKPPSPLKVKRTFDRELLDAGVGFMTACPVRQVFRDGTGAIRAVEVVNRSGRQTIRAKQVVDATMYGTLGGGPACSGDQVFSRVTVTDGVKPFAEGMIVEQLPGEFPISHTASHATGRVYRCTLRLPMKDGSYPSFAEAEWEARERTWTRRLMDDADQLVWRTPSWKPLEERLRDGAALGTRAAQLAKSGASRPRMPNRDAAAELPVWGKWDVVVVGGGTSGTPAAIAAARAGAKVLLVEYLSVLGGTGTDGMILGYYDGNHCGFTEEFKAANRKYRDAFGLNVRAETWRRMCREAGVTVWLGAMGAGARVENGKVTGVELATPLGCGVVNATCVIDGTGNSDIAAAAGSATEFLSAKEFALQSAGQAPHRLGRGGINSDFGFVDDSNAWDLWLFGVRARAGAPDAWDIAKMPDSRERRRIVADYVLNAQDVTSCRPFPDVVVQAQSRQDSHGYLADDFRFLSEPSAVNVPGKGEMRRQFIVNVPLRSLLPRGLSNIAVVGVSAGCMRDVLPIIRMQADLMNMGYAVGAAAAMAAAKDGDFRKIDRGRLRNFLVGKKILRPETLEWTEDVDVSSDGLVARSVKTMANGFQGSHVVYRPENRARALPLLREAYRQADDPAARQIYAKMLGFLGDPAGVETLLAIVTKKEKIVPVRKAGSFGGGGNGLDGFMIALGRTKDPRAWSALAPQLAQIRAGAPVGAVRGITLALEALADPQAAPALAQTLRNSGFSGWSVADPKTLPPQGGYGLGPEMDNCIRELAFARALWACGDHDGIARCTLEAYAADPRGVLSVHAKAVLGSRDRK